LPEGDCVERGVSRDMNGGVLLRGREWKFLPGVFSVMGEGG